LSSACRKKTNLVLAEIVGEVGYHDLSLGRNTIFWWATLLLWSRSTTGLGVFAFLGSGRSRLVGFIGDI